MAQELGLLRGAGAPQNGVAVGEAAKALDDHLMAAGEVGEALEGFARRAARLLGRQRLEQGHASGLLLPGLRMLQRQVEEDPSQRGEGLVSAKGQPLEAESPGLGILGKGRRGIAMNVARQLVQQQDQRQPADRDLGPVGEFALCGALCQLTKAVRQQRVRLAAFAPPEGGLPGGAGSVA